MQKLKKLTSTDGVGMVHEEGGQGFRYRRLAMELEHRIVTGQYRVGERMPSLRSLHQRSGYSITTVAQAYAELQTRGLVEPRSKSGFFVCAGERMLPLPRGGGHGLERPRKVTISSLAESILSVLHDPSALPFGAALPACELLPLRQLARAARSVRQRYFTGHGLGYGHPQGEEVLRRRIAARMVHVGRQVEAGELVITNGCLDAIQLCLRAVAQPGDIIITESPTFTCYLQLIEQLGLMALEIPTDPQNGIDLSLLEEALFNSTWRRNRVAACLLNPSFHNPLGFDMPPARKQELVELLAAQQIPVIEDDIYGDLHFGTTRPVPLKRFDSQGLVLYCSSFSKTLAPDFRVGWIMPGRYHEQIARLQFNSSIARSKLPQLIVADFLEHEQYDRHLRRLRQAISHQVASTARAIGRYFPDGTKLTAPNGGYILWVELDEAIDGMELYQRAKAENIFIIPGVISTSTGRFKNCIRISCGTPWNEAMEQGMERLGGLARRMVEGDG